MLSFFRNIRQKLIEHENVRKYIWYALGEILLVMIGILLALQVNNWNEERKNLTLANQYLISLKGDLVEDLDMLEKGYEGGLADSVQLSSIIKRIKDAGLNPDTIKSLILVEFDGLVRAPRPHNRKTYNTLISTGDIGLLNKEIAQNLEELVKEQDISIRLINGPLDSYLQLYISFSQNYPLGGNPFSEELVPIFYDQIDAIQLLNEFNNLSALKTVNSNRLMNRKRVLEKKTKELIEVIDQKLK